MEIHPLRTEAELAQALDLTAAAWREAFDHVLSPAELDSVAAATTSDVQTKFESLQEAPDSVVLVAEDDGGDVAGWLSSTWHPERRKAYAHEGEADIRTLYVRPANWGEGTGTALLDAALDSVPDSLDAVVLETFRANEQGRAFYESRGFAVRGTGQFDVGENSYPTVVLERER